MRVKMFISYLNNCVQGSWLWISVRDNKEVLWSIINGELIKCFKTRLCPITVLSTTWLISQTVCVSIAYQLSEVILDC